MAMRHGGIGRRLAVETKKATRPLRVLLKALAGFLKNYNRLLIIAAVLSLVYAGTQLINPLILSKGIDAVDPRITDPIMFFGLNLLEMSGKNLAIMFSLIYISFGILGFIINSFSTRVLSKVGAYLVNDIRMVVYNKLINSSMSYIKSEQSGNVTARITGDTSEIATGIQVFITIAVQLILFVATFVLVLVLAGWQVILICLASIPFALLLSGVLSTVGRRIILKIRQAFGIVSGKMAESIAGVAVSKSFNQEENLSNQMRVLNQQHYDMSKKFGLMMNFMMPLISTIASLVTTAILWVGGAIDMSIGQIFLGTALAAQFLRPVTHLSMMFPQLQTSLGALDRVLDVVEATPALKDAPDAEPLKENYSVKFENVWFAYEDNNYVIKDVSFDVKKGETIALAGHTGAGKTTIVSMLLTRFYDVDKGSIKIGDQEIRQIQQDTLRQSLGLIPQEPFLFTATVLDNIKYGKPDATEEEIYKICKLIGADTFIEALPEGYNTMVREGGKQLSAGQRQIITIARAMLSDPKILILDEATSRLDAYSESLVQNAQRILFKNRTTFVIAHRLSTIHDADNIIVFENGELIEMGNHNELMKKEGIYADLYNTYYSFQGIESIDVEAYLDEDEEIELSPMVIIAMMQKGPEGHAKIKKLVDEGQITEEKVQKAMMMMKKDGKMKMPSGQSSH